MNTSTATPEIQEAIKQRIQLQEWMKTAAAKEMELRQKIAKHFFPTPKEGSNTYREPGLKVKLQHNVTRKLETEKLDEVMPQMDPEHRRLGTLIVYEPVFSLAWYRALPDDQRKIFDQCLEIKDGSPQLEVEVSDPAQEAAQASEPAAPKKRGRKPKAQS